MTNNKKTSSIKRTTASIKRKTASVERKTRSVKRTTARIVKDGSRHSGSCPHCASLNVIQKKGYKSCQDCGAGFNEAGEILRSGFLDIHYSLDVQAPNGRTLWCENLSILFEAQCDVAAALKINPGSSFARWLNTFDKAGTGVLDDPTLIPTVTKIVSKICKYESHIRDPYNLNAIKNLAEALPMAGKLCLTLKR